MLIYKTKSISWVLIKPPFSKRLQTGAGTLPALVYLIYAVVVFGYKIVCIFRFGFVPLPNFGYDKGRALPF
jgi:hypothetical protein